jgi:hypothetical protein
MSHRCTQPIELAALVALRADDPRRLEAMACPRCDSLLRAMDTFLEGDASVPPEELAQAKDALASALAAQHVRAPGQRVRRTERADRHNLPRWGWGLGLAAAVAMVVYLGAPDQLRPARPSGTLRGGATAPALDLPLSWASADDTGQLRLTWPAVTGATRYEVELYSAALDTIGAFTSVAGPSLTIDTAAFGPDGPAGALCRIRAYGAAGPAGASRLVPLPAR